jgi:hypothetical protein
MPGIPTGRQALGESEPALPNEQASPGGTGSTKVTWWPSRCSQAAGASADDAGAEDDHVHAGEFCENRPHHQSSRILLILLIRLSDTRTAMRETSSTVPTVISHDHQLAPDAGLFAVARGPAASRRPRGK